AGRALARIAVTDPSPSGSPPSPTGLAPSPHRARPGGGRFLHKKGAAPSLLRPHRARPGGAGAYAPARRFSASQVCCVSPRSTGASPVGAEKGCPSFLCKNLRPTGASPVGGDRRAKPRHGAQTHAPPGRARWGQCAIRAKVVNSRSELTTLKELLSAPQRPVVIISPRFDCQDTSLFPERGDYSCTRSHAPGWRP